ncbi:hypothetical protein BGZ83_010940 [Gryganskiella cystojenkinii]|nr:hypothetical protein BGZ83_010940 [Gryganskiella cystojenkinii]
MLVVASILSSSTTTQVSAQSTNKPQCAPLHVLYKNWVASCTKNGTAIPNADSDPLWKPCVCKAGFYPLAVANENCMLAGSSETHKITVASLNGLCQGFANYVDAGAQTPDPLLGPALASATSISAAAPAPTQPSGGNTNAGHRAVGLEGTGVIVAALTATVVLATSLVI